VKRVFVSYPFSSNPTGNSAAVAVIARAIVLAGDLPLAPHCYLPTLVDERSERALALQLCLALLELCDEVRVYGEPSDGMKLEIAEAYRLGIPVVDGVTGERLLAKEEPPQ
jgi:hypothetical protein